MTSRHERARTVRPRADVYLKPLHGEEEEASEGVDTEETNGKKGVVPENEGSKVTIDTDTRPVWEKMQEKVDKLADQVTRHFEDEQQQGARKPPIVNTPPQPTKEEMEQHATTHTPYASWCRHCVAARAVRRKHPSKGRGAAIVPDVDKGIDGPIKVSMDYMYLHKRVGKDREV